MTLHRLDLPELLDEHDAPQADLERSLRDLHRFNTLAGGGRVYRKLVRRLFGGAPRGVVIDLGAGTADLVGSLGVRAVALDFNLRHLLYRRQAWSALRVVADARQLPFRDGAADAITSSHFFHHFTAEENAAILAESLRVARVGVAVTDTERHAVPLFFVRMLAVLRLVGRITRYDAPASVRRGYTMDEVRAIAARSGAARAVVESYAPFRWGLLLWK